MYALRKTPEEWTEQEAIPKASAENEEHVALPHTTAEERQQMIAKAAYYRYVQRAGLSNDPVADWLAAERDVDAALGGEAASKSDFMRWLATLLAEVQGQLEELGNEADIATAAMKSRYEVHLAVLGEKYEAARGKLVEIREHADDSWTQLKDCAEKSITELRTAMRQAFSSLRR